MLVTMEGEETLANSNRIDPGESRIGNLYDHDPDTPQPRALLERPNDEVVMSVFWDRAGDPISRWFMARARWGDDPGRTRYSYGVPRLLTFRDERGVVHLVQCHSAGMNGQLLTGLGRGKIKARYIVFDRTPSDETYEHVHGVRSSISGLREWLGVQSVRRDATTTDEHGLVQAVTYTLQSPEASEVPAVEGLTLVPYWHVESEQSDVVSLHQQLYVETLYHDARSWETHLAVHSGIRDLVALSRWRKEQFVELLARCKSEDDQIETATQWAPTLAHDLLSDPPEPTRRQYLIEYSDIGLDGVATWLQMRDDYKRAVDPLLSSLYADTIQVESAVSQAGIGLEALGYLLAQRVHGHTEKQANNLKYDQRFQLIAEPLSDVLPFSVPDWAEGFANAYNAVKHANRTLPDVIELANRWREAVLVFRCWAATTLGVDHRALEHRVAKDHQASEYEAL